MDEDQLQRLAQDIVELKAAVKKNDPLLREVLTRKGWALLGLSGGPWHHPIRPPPPHFLSVAYGSFDAIPAHLASGDLGGPPPRHGRGRRVEDGPLGKADRGGGSRFRLG